MKKPTVSVVMAVYNAQEYINIAVDSILLQKFKDLELVIVDDGSTDQTASIIRNYDDPRIKYIQQKNGGLANALNNGIRHASGEYVARMDADDISYPDRLKKQVGFLERNKEVAMVGSSFDVIDENGCVMDKSFHLDRPNDVHIEFLVRNPFGHGSVMVRREVLDELGVYDEQQTIEDYELWWRIAKRYPVGNLSEHLYAWRVVKSGISHGGSMKRQQPIHKLMLRIWSEQPLHRYSKKQTLDSLKHYSKIGPEYYEQFVYMQAALCLGMIKMRRYWTGLRFLRDILSIEDVRKALKDLRKNPRSHNYNLANIYRD